MYELEFKSHDEIEILEVVATGKLNLESAIEISLSGYKIKQKKNKNSIMFSSWLKNTSYP